MFKELLDSLSRRSKKEFPLKSTITNLKARQLRS